MKRWKKLTLGVVLLAALSQIPFVYRRIRIGQLADKIQAANSNRAPAETTSHKDLAGVIHVHTSLGGHTTASLEDLIEGSKGLDFVVITEHTASLVDTAAQTLNGVFEGILFVGGNELDTHTSDRLLLIPGTHEAYVRRNTKTPEFLAPFQEEGRLAFVTYPDRFLSWTTSKFDGVEVLNLSSSTRGVNYPLFILDMVWAYRSYPELALTMHLARPDENLRKYDDAAKHRRITLFAGSDAHSNLGFHAFGDDTGQSLIELKFDDYATVFRVVRTHILLEEGSSLTRETLISALRRGHCYVGFDILGETKGFSFSAGDKIQGDEVTMADGLLLKVKVPVGAHIVLLNNGVPVAESEDARTLEFQPKERGAYRVEVFRDSLGKPFDRLPWILSNPIYVR